MNEDVRRWVPELCVLERDERRRGLLDDLSALYVAITRARQGVHLVMNHAQGGSFPTGAKLIARALIRATVPARGGMFANAPSFAEAFAVPFDIDVAARAEAFWSHDFGAIPVVLAAPLPQVGVVQAAPPVRIVARAAARAAAPSEQGGGAKLDLWQFDPFTDDDVALRGVLVHECFREIESVAALATAPARAALVARAARRAAIEKGEPVPAKLVGEDEALLARIAVGATGAALGAGPAIRVRTELPFVRDSAGGLVHGRIDRLELELRDGRVAGARILDFKTGAVGATGEAFEEKVRGYFGQLAGYAAAVAEMHGLEPGAIRLALLFVDRDEVVEKSAASIDF
ncbi:MAG: PD-(D/E)XK nuclease family protein, partial [Planctomycetota bacterium]